MSELWPTLALSLEISLAATAICAFLAIPVAALLARRHFFAKSFLESILFVPIVLPPTVVGFLLLEVFGLSSPIGRWLFSHFSYTLIFSIPLAVMANVVVAFPLVYLPAKAGFASIGREYIDLAQLLGASRWALFWQVMVPMARRPILSGLLLGFARALGEFGATNMVFGSRIGRTTLPISVYADYEQGNGRHAIPAVIALLMISLSVSLVFNFKPLTHAESQNT